MKVQKNHVEQRNVDHACHLCCLTCYYNLVKYKLIFRTYVLKGVKCGSICTFGRSTIDSMIAKNCCCVTLKGDDNIIFILVGPMHQLLTLFICVFVICKIYALEACT